MNTFVSWYIIVIVVGMLLATWWLIRWTSKPHQTDAAEGDVTGHSWDGLQEYNNPLPRWWLWLFYITLIFGVIYLALFPGLGKFKGLLGWSEISQYKHEMSTANARYAPIFAAYAKQPIPVLAKDASAMAAGQRLFLNYCSQCHGSDAGGAIGFPNLRDNDWLHGGKPEQIQQTILNGRHGVMPAWGPVLGKQGVDEVAAYVTTLSGREADPKLVSAGKSKFAMYCVACHGADGKGNQTIGAPNLTDRTWLYGGSLAAIKKTITDGRQGQMPAWKDFLGEDKVHLLAAYVYSLSRE
ncbi:MAG: cytochrome-c oxidase, cbb3-type subunit III [Gammaproteobacteria bacterium]